MLTQITQILKDMNPQASLTLALIAGILAFAVVQCFKYLFRHLNIRKAGWPPAHCDADGDQVEQDDDDSDD